jgi:hypothetical protein
VRRFLATVVVFVSFVSLASFASAQMPDVRQMSGMPLPVGDLPVGTVTARVIRGQVTNPLEGQTVELTADGATTKGKTDAAGRATFSRLSPGARVKVSVTVDGERIESRDFAVPNAGGIRLMLVATDPAAAKEESRLAQEPAVAGSVVFGGESRFVVELGDDALNVFTIMQILNAEKRPVKTDPIVFDLPSGAVGVGLMGDAPPDAVAAGSKVTVPGPLPPGQTLLQFAYSIPLGRATIAIEQKLPAALTQVSVIVQKVGAMQLASPQIGQRREMPAEGQTYIVGQGGALKAGDTVSLTLSGLPSRALWPRALTVALAAAILLGGAWAATRQPRADAAAPRRNLHGRREKLFAELASLEAQRRKGSIDPETYAGRRESLVTALEDLYRGLDREVA